VGFGETPNPARVDACAPQTLWHDENFVSPGILHFGSRSVTAHINVSAARIEWTKHVSRFVGNCLGGWKCGRLRRLRG
jgi:hypothetical protein